MKVVYLRKMRVAWVVVWITSVISSWDAPAAPSKTLQDMPPGISPVQIEKKEKTRATPASVDEWLKWSEDGEGIKDQAEAERAKKLAEKLAQGNLLDDEVFFARVDRFVKHFNSWKPEYLRYLNSNPMLIVNARLSAKAYWDNFNQQRGHMMIAFPFEAELARLSGDLSHMKNLPQVAGSDKYRNRILWMVDTINVFNKELDRMDVNAYNTRVGQLMVQYIDNPERRDAIAFLLLRNSADVQPEIFLHEKADWALTLTHQFGYLYKWAAIGAMVYTGRKGIWDFVRNLSGMTRQRYLQQEVVWTNFVRRNFGSTGYSNIPPVDLTPLQVQELKKSVLKAAGAKVAKTFGQDPELVAASVRAQTKEMKEATQSFFDWLGETRLAKIDRAVYRFTQPKGPQLTPEEVRALPRFKRMQRTWRPFMITGGAMAVLAAAGTSIEQFIITHEVVKVNPLIALPVIQQLLIAQMEEDVLSATETRNGVPSIDSVLDGMTELSKSNEGQEKIKSDRIGKKKDLKNTRERIKSWQDQIRHLMDVKNQGQGFLALTPLTQLSDAQLLDLSHSKEPGAIEFSKRERTLLEIARSSPELKTRLKKLDEYLELHRREDQPLTEAYTHLDVLKDTVLDLVQKYNEVATLISPLLVKPHVSETELKTNVDENEDDDDAEEDKDLRIPEL